VKGQFEAHRVNLSRALPFVLHGCYQQLRSLTFREFQAQGLELTPEQWIVLVRLWQRDGQSQSQLAESALRDAPTMSRILTTMEGAGLVQRVADPEDGRTNLIRLTRAGKALEPRLVPIAQTLVARMERDIPERDLEITLQTLRRMLKNLS
jgi:DNA-binding MarR family transcriptional regulator